MNSSIKDSIEKLGFHVYHADDEHLCVTTPQTFSSGRPACYFISQNNNKIILNDFSLNFHAMSDCLPQPEKTENIISRLVRNTHTNGLIRFEKHRIWCKAGVQDLEFAIGHYLNVLGRLTSYEAKPTADQELEEILSEIESFLLYKFGKDNLISKPKVLGHTGTSYDFNYRSGSKFIDYAKPEAEKTGKLLRKMFDVQNLQNDAEFQIILEDRINKDHFRREAEILGNMASIMPASSILSS